MKRDSLKNTNFAPNVIFTEERIRHTLVKGTLSTLLPTINGLEGLEREQMVERLRDLFYDFKNYIGQLPEWQDNDQLRELDEIFDGAGWEDQGLRWTAEDPGDDEDIFVVYFTNKEHTTWRLD